ncbi:MAG: bifunctional hydroxymethylpyrimidine kinase/phosphomethylpyrimidine kinase [Candidatus Coatesbacteria bacterium]|nr:MAG: bifunctional hydroxymethylpyrimidine kinase/phosphomethylpyrimidine kinase [Candidatus Coatesbacteria bacterium]
MKSKTALTIGGLDPSGGAGITADVVTFAAIGIHGVAAATAVTYQNTKGVAGFAAVSDRDLQAQLDAVLDDIEVVAVKVGMLATDGLVRTLEPYLVRFRDQGLPVIFDPVIKAGAGQPLYEGVPEKDFPDAVLPYVALATPNSEELAYLIGDEPATGLGDLRTQVRVFQSRFGVPILATGGHVKADDDVVDVLFTGSEMRESRRDRVRTDIHGTGCLLAAAVTAYVANGLDLLSAFDRAEQYVTAAVTAAFAPGEGARFPDRTAAVFGDAQRWRVYNNVVRAVNVFTAASNASKLVPEVGTNIAYALSGARGPEEVCAVPGRIARLEGGVRANAPPAFGASGHMARAVLAAMEHDPAIRSVINVRFGEDVLAACAELRYRVASFDRAQEPAEASAEEGRTVTWGIAQAAAKVDGFPDVVYDRGAVGKEPMVRIFGRDAMEVVRRAVAISRRL